MTVQRINFFSDDGGHHRVLTGIRGWAALSVFFFHVWFQTGKPSFQWTVAGVTWDLTPPISIGFAGVTMFFVLSGYLLSLPFAEWQAGLRERPATGRYIGRRILRVFPAYYAQLALLLLLALVWGWPGPLPDTVSLWKHLLMLFVPPPVGASPLNGVWWTLPIEFSFYLALPLLAFLLKPGRWWILMALCIAAMVGWRYATVVQLGEAHVSQRVIVSYQLPGSLDMFGCGMLAAMIQVNLSRQPAWVHRMLRHNGTLLVALGLMLISAYWLAGDRHHYWANYPVFYLWTPVVSCATAAMVLSGVNGNALTQYLFGNRIIVFFGMISYSYYLWHLPIIDGILASERVAAILGKSFSVTLAASLAVTTILSVLTYLWVERPAMQLRRRRC